jgi:hypothetical protein
MHSDLVAVINYRNLILKIFLGILFSPIILFAIICMYIGFFFFQYIDLVDKNISITEWVWRNKK